MVRFFVVHRRLFLSFTISLCLLAALSALPQPLRLVTRLLLSWDLMTLIYVGTAMRMIMQSDVATCHRRAALYDEGDWAILLLVIGSAVASFIAIFAELSSLMTAQGGLPAGGLIITGVTVALSWTFTHTVFTLHYANLYYNRPGSGKKPAGGLIFPGEREPDYRDFLYYAFVVACTAQTADVSTSSRAMRRLTLVHGIVSFVFNSAILALMINIGASMLASSGAPSQ